MKNLLIRCGQAVLPNRVERQVCVLVQAGKIVEVSTHIEPTDNIQVLDAQNYLLLPGFIDTHVHGAMGADTMDATPEALRTMAICFAQHGVTGFLPTTMTAPRAQIDAVLNCVQAQPSMMQVLGVHVEGPYLNPKRCGAQDPAHMRPADRDEYLAWFERGVVKLITVAPEIHAANLDLISQAQRYGVQVALGHSDATYDQAQQAFALGANQATHTFNAMRGLHHREPGLLGAVMTNPNVFAQLICDNVHVHAAAMNALYKCKGADRICVITDAMEATGLGDGDYTLGTHAVFVREGRARLANGTISGSLATMDVCLRNVLAATGCGLVDGSRMCAHTPAQSIGLGASKGLIQKNYDADLVLMDTELNVVRTIVGGEIVF